MRVRDWRSPEHEFVADHEVEPTPSFATDDRWYPVNDAPTAQRILGYPDVLRAEWASDDARDEQQGRLAGEAYRQRVLAAFADL